MLRAILDELEDFGHRARAVPVERLSELRESYEDLDRRGLLDERFSREQLAGLAFEPPQDIPKPRSLIVVAARDPVVSCTFRWRGDVVSIPVPPTYLHGLRKEQQVVSALETLLPQGHHVKRVNAPKKLLAVRSGLAQYGRNNITYVCGMGSFHRLSVLCSDLSCDNDEWGPPTMMTQCQQCSCCVSACPTGAISEERFLLRAELCITYWNEQPRGVAFPEWLADRWHNSVVGCLRCQRACPENQGLLDYCEFGPDFTEEETEALLDGSPAADLPRALEEKLEQWDLLDWLDVLPRNLEVHFRSAKGRPA